MISIGSKKLVDCQVGSKKVKKIYKGSTKVWPSWNLLYEADVKAGGTSGASTLATIPGFIPGTTKINVVISYISGTWVNKFPTYGTGEQAIRFGNPAAYVEFNADVSPLSDEYLTQATKSTSVISIYKVAESGNYLASLSLYINLQAQLILNNGGNTLSDFSDPVHLQVYYQ